MAKRLTLDETKNCLRAWRELGDEDALTLLTVCNQGLVVFIAKKFIDKGITFEELLSAGNEGLIRAINKFDYKERAIGGFSAYISMAIENQIKMELRKYNKHSSVLSLDHPIGFDKDGDELKLEDILGTDGDEMLNEIILQMKSDIVRESLLCLTSREQKIIFLRYGLDDDHRKTQAECAEIFSCSKALIARQEQKALIKMRHPRNTKKLKDLIED